MEFKPIARAARYIWGLAGVAIIALFGITAVVGFIVIDQAFALIIGVAMTLLAAWWWLVSGRRWRAWGYAEESRELVIKRGVLVKRTTIVPYGRMQFVELKQGPLDRLISTASVLLHTAAAATDAHIPLLPIEEAERLRERLTRLGEAHAAGL